MKLSQASSDINPIETRGKKRLTKNGKQYLSKEDFYEEIEKNFSKHILPLAKLSNELT